MKLLILLGAIALIRATPVSENCHAVTLKNSPLKYEREVLTTGWTEPFMLAIDYSSNTLYFSYGTGRSSTDKSTESMTAKLTFKDKEFKNITSVSNGFAQTVDNTNHVVYISSYNNIYKYDPKKDTAELYAASGNGIIWYLYFHDYLYYTTLPPQFLYVVKNGVSSKVKDLEDTTVDMFVIDNDGDMFYSNDTGFYSQQKGTKYAVAYKLYDSVIAGGLTLDKNGIVHVCMDDGIYVVNKYKKSFEKILELDDAYDIVFDGDNNLVYSKTNSVYILKPNVNLSC